MLIRTEITGIGDPFVLRVGDKYYAYATYTASVSEGFHCYISENLTDWVDSGYCYRNSSWGEDSFWAPEVYERNGKYYMIYTARWKKNHSLRIGLAVSDTPTGPFKDIKDGPLFDLGYACIDATLLFDDDGKIYLYYARDCSENVVGGAHVSEIYCVELSENLLHFITQPKRIATPDVEWETSRDPMWLWNEGPAVLKHNGRYYLNYSVNYFACPEYSVGCAVADSPVGPFVKYGYPVLAKGEGDFSGPGHNSFFFDRSGKLLTAFHIHTYPDQPSGNRRMCIGEVEIDKNGIFHIVL